MKKQNETGTQEVPIRPYTLKQLSCFYGVSTKTIRKWMKPFENEIGIKYGRYYMIPQVKIMFHHLGHPKMYTENV